MQLPWEPLFTVERSNKPEVTVSGIISVWEGRSRSLLSIGDVFTPLWSRSLLKPWQLLGHLPVLKKAYPALRSQHFAMMLSSHNAESWHLDYLKEIMLYGGIDEENLKCPACYPMAQEIKFQLKARGARPKALYNPCSGKHAGLLLAIKAQGGDLDDYLNGRAAHFGPLKKILSWLLRLDSPELPETIDGCKLPNYSLSSAQLAQMFGALTDRLSQKELKNAPAEIQPALEEWDELRAFMTQHPTLIGGTDRLDTKLMSGLLTPGSELTIVAKEGAEGLLGIGISPCPQLPSGLGILIKLASGYDARYMEIVATALLEQLNLREAPVFDAQNKHLETQFHFRINEYQEA